MSVIAKQFRRFWNPGLAEQTASRVRPALAAMLGHSRIQMVLRYAHPTQQHQAQAMQRLEEFNAAKQIADLRKKTRTRYRFRYSEPPEDFSPVGMQLKRVEARVGIEPTHKGFADLSLTTWVPRPTIKASSYGRNKSSHELSIITDRSVARCRKVAA
jgi:hypothetical protein